MPTGKTQKLGLGFPVALVDVPAFSTSTAGIAGVDNRDRNSGLLGFVLDKGAKLAEAPIVQSVALLFSGLNGFSNVRKVFHRNRQTGAFSSGNDCLADAVILVLLKPLLPAAHLAKTLLCSPRSYALQRRPTFGIVPALGFDRRTGILVARAVGGYVNHAEVNTQHAIWREEFRVVEVAHSGEIPLSAHEHEIDFTLSMLEQFALMVAANVGNLIAPSQKPDGNNIFGAKTKDAVIVRLRGMFSERALYFLVNLVRVGNFCNAAYRDLRGDFKLGAQFVITKFMKVVLPKDLGFPRFAGQPVTSLVATLKRGAQRCLLIFSRVQFEIGYKFHTFKYRGAFPNVKNKNKQSFGLPAIPPHA